MIPVRECLDALIIRGPKDVEPEFKSILKDELNVLEIIYEYSKKESMELVTTQNEESLKRTKERTQHREYVEERKRQGLKQGD
jgi:hypothetical protein